nr:MAG: replication associated protein [Smacoviridae sp.]
MKVWTREDVIRILEPIAERFCVGDEKGDTTGYEHLQGRVVFKVGKSLKTLVNMGLGWHWTPTHVRDFLYVEKEGNFYRSWEKTISKWANIELKAWQKAILEELDNQNDRQVTVIYDEDGNHGKTWFAKYCVATHRATYCPPMQDAQDFMAFAMAKPDKAYIFDMPRSESVKQRKGMWSAIEQIKNGYLYDKRYSFRDMWIDSPKIIVFCNELPDMDTLSRDRWRLYRFEDLAGIADWIVPMEVN